MTQHDGPAFSEAELDSVRTLIETVRTQQPGTSREDACNIVANQFGGSMAAHVAEIQRRHAAQVEYTSAIQDKQVALDLPDQQWYAGPDSSATAWIRYKAALSKKLPESSVETIDIESTAVVGSLANPELGKYDAGDMKKKGLVLGYVQSGKTSNYTAVIAKAAAAGYRLVIILAGMHSSLRQQTQRRLDSDLHTDLEAFKIGARSFGWHSFTSAPDEDDEGRGYLDRFDFKAKADHEVAGEISIANGKVLLAVVKKNKSKLTNLATFLERAGDALKKYPVLIIDDEADQASPNTNDPEQDPSTINSLVRDIWKAVPHGTYVAYTATPFANLLMDPNNPDEMYPSDFVFAMAKPTGYMGSAEFFGENGEDPERNLVRRITAKEQEQLCPPKKKKKGETPKEPQMPESLEYAIRWFLLATAIRHHRGDQKHATFLLHTSMQKQSHFQGQYLIDQFLRDERFDLEHHFDDFADRLRSVFEQEVDIQPLEQSVDFEEILDEACAVLRDIEVKVDNSESENRVSYLGDHARNTIAIGGNTLSRGLTLEGLTVSYFLRSSRTYDTLLQMGRWFGYRPGYEDLVRVWLAPTLSESFAFLADVEADLRSEVANMIEEKMKPSAFPIRLRSHPSAIDFINMYGSEVDRLMPTSANKMRHAVEVQMSLQSAQRQTHRLDLTEDAIEANTQLFNELVNELSSMLTAEKIGKRGHTVFRGVPTRKLLPFFDRFKHSVRLKSLSADVTVPWLQRYADGAQWNVVLVNGATRKQVPLGERQEITLTKKLRFGVADLGESDVSIKALTSPSELRIDLPEDLPETTPRQSIQYRGAKMGGRGLLLLYMLDKDAKATKNQETANSRFSLDTAKHVPAYGVVFPSVKTEGADRAYVAVEIDRPTSLDVDDEDDS